MQGLSLADLPTKSSVAGSAFMGTSILWTFWIQDLVERPARHTPTRNLCQGNASYTLLGCSPTWRSTWSMAHPQSPFPEVLNLQQSILSPGSTQHFCHQLHSFIFPVPGSLWDLHLSLNSFTPDAQSQAHSLVHSHTWKQPHTGRDVLSLQRVSSK